MNVFRTFWRSIKDLFEDLLVLLVANVLWVLINAPVVIAILLFSNVGFIVFVLLLVGALTLGPTNAGLYTIAERVADGRTSSWRDFFRGMRTYARLSWQVYGIWIAGLIVILFNLQFYNLNSGPIAALISIIFLYLALIWLEFLIYLGPLMIIQTDKRLRTIARNAALMAFGRPVFTFITLVLMVLIGIISVAAPILPFLITFAFLAHWGFRATLTLIAEEEARREAAAEKALAQAADKGRGGQVRPRE